MSELTREDLFNYLSNVMNEVSVRDFTADPDSLKEHEKEAYFLRKGLCTLAKELMVHYNLESPSAQ